MLRIAMVSFSAITFAGFATGSASANQAVVSQKFMQLAQTTCVFIGADNMRISRKDLQPRCSLHGVLTCSVIKCTANGLVGSC
jgi:hypothetical protein